jgi:DNA ligase (NAD+)
LLAKEIARYKRAYYEGNPLVSDAEYDRLESKLRDLDPNHPILKFVGTDKVGKVSHDPPMLSVNKLTSVENVVKWADSNKIVVGYKVDGLTVKLVFLDGLLVQGSTRGNGELGDDITEQARNLHNVPHEIPEKNYCEIRGEAFIPLSTFNSFDESHKSPRNLATGTIKAKDPNKVMERGQSWSSES